jgi:hypothetical protein
MGHTSITLGLLFGLTAVVSQLPDGLFETRATQRTSAIAAQADAEKDVALRDVTAAAVVESLRSRFAGSDIEFKFDSFDSRQLSQRDLQLRGAGQFRIQGGVAWLPILYSASYDTATGSMQIPDITFSAQPAGGRQASIDAAALDAMVGRQLSEEFATQAVEFNLGTVKMVAGDQRYAMVDGVGVASFAGEGAATVSVQAVLDRVTGKWLGVSYALGSDAA